MLRHRLKLISILTAGILCLSGCGIIQQASSADSYESESVVSQPNQNVLEQETTPEFGQDIVLSTSELPVARPASTQYWNEQPRKLGPVTITPKDSGEFTETITPLSPERSKLATDDGIDDFVPGYYRLDPSGKRFTGRNDLQINLPDATDVITEENFYMNPEDANTAEDENTAAEDAAMRMGDDGNAVLFVEPEGAAEP